MLELQTSAQSSFQHKIFFNTSQNLLKNRNWAFTVGRYFTYLLFQILWMIVGTNLFYFRLNLESKNHYFWAHNVLSRKPVHRYYRHFLFFFQIVKKVGALRFNKIKITAEKAFNRVQLCMEGNQESRNKDKTFFLVFLSIHGPFLNPYTAKCACFHFPSIIWYLHF